MREPGARVAWSVRSYAGRMDGISKVHRVMLDDVAYCGEEIPDPRMDFPLLKSLRPCATCERLYKNVRAAEQPPQLEASA